MTAAFLNANISIEPKKEREGKKNEEKKADIWGCNYNESNYFYGGVCSKRS